MHLVEFTQDAFSQTNQECIELNLHKMHLVKLTRMHLVKFTKDAFSQTNQECIESNLPRMHLGKFTQNALSLIYIYIIILESNCHCSSWFCFKYFWSY